MKSLECRPTLAISSPSLALIVLSVFFSVQPVTPCFGLVPQKTVCHPSSSLFWSSRRRHGHRLLADSRNGKTEADTSEDSKSFSTEMGGDDSSLTAPICRVVTRADAKLPDKPPMLPSSLFRRESQLLNGTSNNDDNILDKLDAYYNAEAHKITRRVSYFDQPSGIDGNGEIQIGVDRNEEEYLVSVLRGSLEDAGFQLLSRRDLDLCERLNAGYLLRLSILPDVKELDQGIAQEFYPERFYSGNGTAINPEEILFDGRVLVYWRGYAEEVTRGRLLLPKIDYLQASLVQRSAAWVKSQLDAVESKLARRMFRLITSIRQSFRESLMHMIEMLPIKTMAKALRTMLMGLDDSARNATDATRRSVANKEGLFTLSRYGGSTKKFVGSPNPNDALDPFTICEIDYSEPALRPNMNSKFQRRQAKNSNAERCLYQEINHQTLTCEYDETMFRKGASPTMQLLDRVSISNLVDFFSSSGRKKLLKTLVVRSELVEPTYEEVVVIWRPLNKVNKPKFVPPEFVVEFADMFDIEGFERPPKEEAEPPLSRLEMRNFQGVQMANLPAVLPKTKLIFRPADAFLFDAVSFITFLLVASSIKLDNPRLDLLALVSVSVWLFRTVKKYANKLARYDLLVKTFLTSKISYRNSGAVKYLASEAGSQRAIRAALVHSWVLELYKTWSSGGGPAPLKRSHLLDKCRDGINSLLRMDRLVDVDSQKAIQDLEDLGIITLDENGEVVTNVMTQEEALTAIKYAWREIIDPPSEINKKSSDRYRGSKIEDDLQNVLKGGNDKSDLAFFSSDLFTAN